MFKNSKNRKWTMLRAHGMDRIVAT